MKIILFVISISILLIFSCTEKPNVEQIKQDLIKADLEFSNLSVEKGKNLAFSSYMHDQGVMLRPNGMPYKSKAVLDSVQSTRPDTSYTLKWKPLDADVSLSGDLGYTYGIWLLTTADTSLMGTYATVWKKDENGNWKFVLDTGNDGLGKDEEREKAKFN